MEQWRLLQTQYGFFLLLLCESDGPVGGALQAWPGKSWLCDRLYHSLLVELFYKIRNWICPVSKGYRAVKALFFFCWRQGKVFFWEALITKHFGKLVQWRLQELPRVLVRALRRQLCPSGPSGEAFEPMPPGSHPLPRKQQFVA